MAAGFPLRLSSAGVSSSVRVGPLPAAIVYGVLWNWTFAVLNPIRGPLKSHGPPDAVAKGRLCSSTDMCKVQVRTSNGADCSEHIGSFYVRARSEVAAPNIPVRLHLPGVGRNLHDHVAAWVPRAAS